MLKFIEQLESGNWVVRLPGSKDLSGEYLPDEYLPGEYATKQAAEYARGIDVGILKELHELIVIVRGRPISLAGLREAVGDV